MKYSHKKYLFKYGQGQRFVDLLRRVHMSKKRQVSLYSVIKIFFKNIKEDDILDRANGVAYNFILAIFPTIIFLFTLIPYISSVIPDVNTNSIMEFLGSMMPQSMYEVVASTIEDIIGNSRGGLLTFGVLFALFLATNGMMALMRAFNACYNTQEKRGLIKTRLIATGLTLNLSLVLFLAVILLVVGQLVLDYVLAYLPEFAWLNADTYTLYLLFVLRFVVIFIVFFLAIATIYYFGPAIHYDWRFFSLGSLIATLGTMGVSYGFSYYITHFGSYNKIYGSIGVLIALMIWVQLVTTVLLFGYEIDASIHEAKTKAALWEARKKNA
ncbi:YihY/virulence factor BrkB family protein [Chryseotalea sanaruensis]|uniref:YihY/virulence factor BrkB family protein n=1 Tax=Chryseotalea sanaruensis TaxID=2482724 RepID=A0A401U7G4_9BACT|nr:YihY/virulence factor BrkB family protein [Chryseotalea sanaruensis]GCC50828.1 YihY/virulence factor BrkB family protein [Chryseotalea sanaruensis]